MTSATRSGSATLRHVISDVTTRVQGGETFNESIAKHPRVFDRLFVSMVKAGEHGGLLAEILDRLAGFLEASARLRKKVKSAMTYPVIVICIAFAITTFLLVKVVPIFGEIFKDFGAKLPGSHAIPDRCQRFHAERMVFPDRRLRRRDFSGSALSCARRAASNCATAGS